MADNDILEDDDFEKLLNSFINDAGDDEPDSSATDENTHVSNMPAKNNDTEVVDYAAQLSPEGQEINATITDEDLDAALVSSLQDAKTEAQESQNQPMLGSDESELAQAFLNFYNSVNKLAGIYLNESYQCSFEIDDLYPNYKPSTGKILSDDVVNGWLLLTKMFPKELGNFPLKSSDEALLNLAENLPNADLQLAVISYVEILIDIESCELSYQAKFIKYQEKHIKRLMYEEYLARKERQRKFTEALAQKNFPVDADRLISNYFRVAQKDVNGAFQALTTNPAIFAPIDFSKIKPRWFGLLKVTPQDGIRINLEIGNFLKRLKV
ncbi:MAG: hypothetical protein Q4D80_00940 [Pseudomonadota bacterium]|nr:hypothetical protein [Pseudomonadota bacterium]